jgi:hypothetical protein
VAIDVLDELAIFFRLGHHRGPFGIGEEAPQRFSRSAILSSAGI